MYETVKVGEADGVLGTSTDEHGKNVYTLSWEHQVGNIGGLHIPLWETFHTMRL